LQGVDAGMPGGKITAVVGPSGAGKSTLLRAINRLIEPTAGEVYLDGEPTSGIDPLDLRRRVGMVFQIPALFGATVEEATLYGARLAGREADAGRLLEMAGLDASFAGKDPRTLSVGEQQRVSIARALALGPGALLMDEPTSALDEAARRRGRGAHPGAERFFGAHDRRGEPRPGSGLPRRSPRRGPCGGPERGRVGQGGTLFRAGRAGEAIHLREVVGWKVFRRRARACSRWGWWQWRWF
jgi:ABC-type uncharacterized transport system YnjBCD ATPase subunit